MRSEQSLPDSDVLVALNRAAMVARLMSGTVHEVNNALQVIAGSVELLEQQPALPPAVVKSLERIRRQGERAAGALAELQAFTKASLEGRERLSLREVVKQAVAFRRYAAARIGVSFTFTADEQSLELVVGNVAYLQQAVLNVLVNAEQAMAGSPGTILVTMLSEAGRVGVEVKDAGPGVSDRAQARLFEPFASTREARDGAGLGLWVTRSIVESCGGSLEVATSPAGTSVVTWLPRG